MTTGITILIGIMQIGFIRPYYRNSKITAVKNVAQMIQSDLVSSNANQQTIQNAFQVAIDNNLCIVMYNQDGRRVYDADNLGASCIFSSSQQEVLDLLDPNLMQDHLKDGETSVYLTNQRTNQEMLIYGKAIHENLANYYLFINTPLEPVDSVVSIFFKQYFLYTIFAIFVSSFVGITIARLIAHPLIQMRQTTEKFAKAQYDVHFDGGSFTETQSLAKALNQASHSLASIDALRRDLLANVSHDIRTPLTNIKAYAELIQDVSGENKEKRDQHLNIIIKEVNYMNRLINDISELSKMQSGQTKLNCTNFELNEVIQDVVEMHYPMIQMGHLELCIDIHESLYVFADEQKITQVLSNYLSNAIKHSDQGRIITIAAFKEKQKVIVQVIDQGDGIEEKDLPYIWDRYQKVSKTYSRTHLNTGLGLAIVQAIMELHHGEYGVSSQVGVGSTFWFSLEVDHA